MAAGFILGTSPMTTALFCGLADLERDCFLSSSEESSTKSDSLFATETDSASEESFTRPWAWA